MKNLPSKLSVLAGAALALALSACSSLQADNPNLMDAHAAYNAAEANPLTHEYASGEMVQARAALDRADRAYNDHDKVQHVDHLAYEAKQHVSIATSVAQRKADEQRVADANAERDRIRLDARTREADQAKADAEQAQSQAMVAQQQAEAARRDAAAAQANAEDTQARNQALVVLLQELNAKQTDRGMVVTMGDVLFDTGRAELKPGAMRSIQKLAELMKDDPARNLSVEGFTDSTGSQATNDALSARRAESVRQALISQGISGDRVMARGYGQAYPVASNDNSAGRQMNRRVEIVLSDQNGRVAQR
ncbi:OmpA family protein [Paucibacter sp. R3-3]|uniref:OmpA family protein n=1 Tax=Roseateles agri TaxID=3098619 RepID=A0ABU5DHD0_9BURK|nr:OmpA family protein [Paucibacter sp. R3-3]MDY0745125.1 OmpA family protein [Paucibacter sp. R3-3]